MGEGFPSQPFFAALRERIGAETARFEKLGLFDVTFGIRVLADARSSGRLVVLQFDTFGCTDVRDLPVDARVTGLDFVLEAPFAVWHTMLTSLDRTGRIDMDHSLNTLTHHDDPIRVLSTDPVGHDKLFRYQESIQAVLDLAGALEAGR